jgi:hypothetical protein
MIAFPSPSRVRRTVCWVESVLGLRRTIAEDDRLADLLAQELHLRGVTLEPPAAVDQSVPQRIVVVTEWDTSYARRLAKSIKAALTREFPAAGTIDRYVDRYTYLRGIDGLTPGTGNRAVATNSQATQIGLLPGIAFSPKDFERAESPSQLDYLRRLAERIKDDERTRGPVAAIGIAGTDVYDKLVILQALRPRFPGVIFFTTDLDARLLHPQEYPTARNVVIASSLDLRLDRELQVYAPTFRSSYQTSMFLAVQQTLHAHAPQVDARKWIPSSSLGHVFEVSRSGFADLTPSLGDSRFYPTASIGDHHAMVGFIAVALVVVAACLITFLVARRRSPIVITILTLMVFALLAYSYASEDVNRREPFAWLQGLSVWPTVLIRVAVALLAALSAASLLSWWQRDCAETIRTCGLAVAPQPFPVALGNLWRRLWPSVYWPCPTTPAGEVDTARLWAEYSSWGGRGYSMFVASLWALMFFGAACAAFSLLPHAPPPARGTAALAWHMASLLIGPFAINFLVFLVLDRVHLCKRLVHHIQSAPSSYPDSATAIARQKTGLPPSVARFCLDVAIVAHHSRTITRAVYLPLVALVLFTLARVGRFDNWTWNYPVVIVLLGSMGFTLFSAWVLDRSADALRREVTRRLRAMQAIVNNGSIPDPIEEHMATVLQNTIRQVEDIRAGAFSPLRSQPVMSFFVIPLGWIAVIVLAEFLASRW